MADGPLISLRGVSAGYGRGTVLRDVDLDINRGDFMAVVGPNGGGKTTLFRVMLGLIVPSAGTVEVMGMPPREGCRRIGYVPQFGVFDRGYPVYAEQVVRMGLRGRQGMLPRRTREQEEAVRRAMEYADVTSFGGRRVGEMSGGQMQRALLARALVSEPEILLLDEPTASLDPSVRGEVHRVLAKAAGDGITVVMITHGLEGIAHCVNRAVRVDGTVSEVCPSALTGAVCGGGLL